MTRIAVEACLTFPMTRQAFAHAQIHDLTRLIHRLYGTVTGLTCNPRVNMWPVLEVNEIRHRSDLLPLDGFLLLPVLLQLLHLGLICSRNLVAPHASLDRRDAGHRGSTGKRMAVLAGNLEIPCMDLMAEGNGLIG